MTRSARRSVRGAAEMPMQINVGDGNVSTCQDIIQLGVRPGDTVNISNLAGGSTLNYFTNGIDQAATTLNAGSNVNVSVPCWIQSQGVSTLILTGGIYG